MEREQITILRTPSVDNGYNKLCYIEATSCFEAEFVIFQICIVVSEGNDNSS